MAEIRERERRGPIYWEVHIWTEGNNGINRWFELLTLTTLPSLQELYAHPHTNCQVENTFEAAPLSLESFPLAKLPFLPLLICGVWEEHPIFADLKS